MFPPTILVLVTLLASLAMALPPQSNHGQKPPPNGLTQAEKCFSNVLPIVREAMLYTNVRVSIKLLLSSHTDIDDGHFPRIISFSFPRFALCSSHLRTPSEWVIIAISSPFFQFHLYTPSMLTSSSPSITARSKRAIRLFAPPNPCLPRDHRRERRGPDQVQFGARFSLLSKTALLKEGCTFFFQGDDSPCNTLFADRFVCVRV